MKRFSSIKTSKLSGYYKVKAYKTTQIYSILLRKNISDYLMPNTLIDFLKIYLLDINLIKFNSTTFLELSTNSFVSFINFFNAIAAAPQWNFFFYCFLYKIHANKSIILFNNITYNIIQASLKYKKDLASIFKKFWNVTNILKTLLLKYLLSCKANMAHILANML